MEEFTIVNDYMISFTIGTILNSIAQLIVLIASIILINKVKKTATYLILFGAILKIIMAVVGIVFPFLTKEPESMLNIQGIISILTGMSLLIFAIGFVLYSTQMIKQNT